MYYQAEIETNVVVFSRHLNLNCVISILQEKNDHLQGLFHESIKPRIADEKPRHIWQIILLVNSRGDNVSCDVIVRNGVNRPTKKQNYINEKNTKRKEKRGKKKKKRKNRERNIALVKVIDILLPKSMFFRIFMLEMFSYQ